MTFHAALNTGAVLQAYALQTYLERLGHRVEFINFRKRKRIVPRQIVGKGIVKTMYKWQDLYQSRKYGKKDLFGAVLKRGDNMYNSLEQLQENPPDYDVYIAGSDQIWNVGSQTEIDRPYYLDFGSNNIKRIAFSASLGECNVPKYLKKDIALAVSKFDSVSIREDSGVEFIRSLVGAEKEIFKIADPTLLLNVDDYQLISKRNKKNQKPYMVSYILAQYSQDQLSIVEYLKKKLNLPIKNLRNPNTCIRLPRAENIVADPKAWLSYVNNSEFIICCSFHAVMFSLIFHKPFIVVTPYSNARIISLLKAIDMEDYVMISYDEKTIDEIVSRDIDWVKVDNMIRTERDKSNDFLLNALS